MAITSGSGDSTGSVTQPTVAYGFTANAGDLIVIVIAQDGAGTWTWPSSATELWDTAFTGAMFTGGYVIAAGGETQLAFTGAGEGSTVSERCEWVFFRIPAGEWHGTTPPEDGTPATGSSTTPNPPSVNNSWNGTNEIGLAFAARDDSAANTVSAYPTNYGTAQIDRNALTSAANIAGAARASGAADPEDPGTFTISASETWGAQTVIVRAAGATTVSPAIVNMLLTPVAPAGINQRVEPGLVSMLLTPVAPSAVKLSVAPAIVNMLLTPVAPAGIHQQVQMDLVSMLLTPVAPSSVSTAGGAQQVDPGLVSMLLTPVSPQVNQRVDVGLVNMLLTPIAPSQVAQQVAPGLVSMALTPIAPDRVAQTSLAAPLVNMLLTPIAPTSIGQIVAPPLVNMLLTPIAPASISQRVTPSLVSMLLTPISPVVQGAIAPPLINMLLTPLAPVISQVGAITMRRMHDIQYHVVIFAPDAAGGPGVPKMELDTDALNLVWQQALNYPAMAAIGLARFNEKLKDLDYMKDHIKVFREDDKGLKTVFSGKVIKPNDTAGDAIIYAWDYVSFLQRSRTGFRILYPEKTIKEIIDAEWALAKAADKSPFEFVTTGTTETPLGLDGTTPIKTNSQFGVVMFDRLFTFFALAELAMANTDNTVVFEITRESPHTFNFWKNRSAQKTSYSFTFPGNLIDYDHQDGHDQITNDIATPILDSTTGAQVEYALTDTASKDEFRRLQAGVAIKTLFGINAGTTETDQQKAALARLLTIAAGIPSTYTLFPRQGDVTPFDGWELGDQFRVTILDPKKTGDWTDSYRKVTGIAGAWSPSAGELLQLSVR